MLCSDVNVLKNGFEELMLKGVVGIHEAWDRGH